MSPKLPDPAPENPDLPTEADIELRVGEGDYGEAMDILAALDTRHEPRRIRPCVTLFVPPKLCMPLPDDEPPYFDDVFPDGRTYRQRCFDACANMADAVAARIPDEPESIITDWRLITLPQGYTQHLAGTALRHPRYGARVMPGLTTSPVLAFAPEQGWALTFGGWYTLGRAT